jgi:hypothetical protein
MAPRSSPSGLSFPRWRVTPAVAVAQLRRRGPPLPPSTLGSPPPLTARSGVDPQAIVLLLSREQSPTTTQRSGSARRSSCRPCKRTGTRNRRGATPPIFAAGERMRTGSTPDGRSLSLPRTISLPRTTSPSSRPCHEPPRTAGVKGEALGGTSRRAGHRVEQPAAHCAHAGRRPGSDWHGIPDSAPATCSATPKSGTHPLPLLTSHTYRNTPIRGPARGFFVR